ncbi:MAG TPA: ABC transporter ATP-binding protein [Herpetosiphonaceae bacterium]|nr:ABC transporter ATP-binding protein [Herpetosiphonaceae bacterium]
MAVANSEFVVERTWEPDHSTPLRWVWSYVRRNMNWVVGLFFGAFGNAAFAAAVPLLTGAAINAVRTGDRDALFWAAIWIVVGQLVRAFVQLLRNFSSEVIGQRLERDVRDELYTSLLGKSMAFHDSKPTGDIMARATNDVREMNLMLNPGINLVVGSGMFLLMPLITAPRMHPQLLIVPALYLLIYFWLVFDYLRQLRPTTTAVRESFGNLNATLAEAIDGIETVKGAAQEERERNRFSAAVAKWRDAFVWQGDVEAVFLPVLLLGVAQGAGFIHSLMLYRAGAINVGDVVAFNGLLLLFGFPTFTAQFAYSQVSSGLAGARRILELITTETDLDENARGYDAPMRGEIVFEDVSFGYNGTLNALEGVSFSIRPGQTVALVGQTGTGKSTLTKLLNRTYDVQSGRILIDGVDVRDWNLATLRRQISMIEQDIFLFSRTIAENIGFGASSATREDIERAARSAQAHDFISRLADGYDTVIGERGVTLSGGQRQRLALARAFLTDPRILVLDDSTSAIDSATEDRIQQAIEQASRDRTTILITHRLSQIRWADVIIVLRAGRVAAVGTHEELMRSSEAYRAIFAKL